MAFIASSKRDQRSEQDFHFRQALRRKTDQTEEHVHFLMAKKKRGATIESGEGKIIAL